MKKKIMIIGAGDFQVPIIEKAAEAYDVVIVAPVISDDLKELAVSCYELDVRAKEEILKIAENEQVEGVITDQTDIPVRTVAFVAEKMGLPGIGYEESMLFTDKALMAEKLTALGIRSIPSKSVSTAEEALGFMRELGAAVLLKPADSQGSRGITVCHKEEEIKDAFEKARKFSSDNTAVIQKFIQGREFFAEGIALNGEFRNLIIGDTIYFDDNRLFAAKNRIVPSNAPAEMVDAVAGMNEKIITGFGLTQGITHSEYIVDEDGPYLIETAARGGGVYISSDLISFSTGVNTEEFLINIAMGTQKELPDITDKKCVCGYMAFFIPQGEIKCLEGVDEVTNLPYVHRNQLYKIHEGMKQASGPSDKTSRFALIVSAGSREELEERMARIKKTLRITIKTDEGEAGPIWE